MADGYINDPVGGSQSLSYEQIQVFHMLWGTNPNPFCVKSVDERFVYANPSFLTFRGIPSGEQIFGLSEKSLESRFLNRREIEIIGNTELFHSICDFSVPEFIVKSVDRKMDSFEYFVFSKTPIYNRTKSLLGAGYYGVNNFILTMDMFLNGVKAASIKNTQPSDIFSAREWDVLLFLQQGYSANEIAQRLHLSQRTVQNHIFHMYNNTGMTSIPGLLNFCEKCDLLHYLPRVFSPMSF